MRRNLLLAVLFGLTMALAASDALAQCCDPASDGNVENACVGAEFPEGCVDPENLGGIYSGPAIGCVGGDASDQTGCLCVPGACYCNGVECDAQACADAAHAACAD